MNQILTTLLLVAIPEALCGYADEGESLEKKSIVNGFNARKDYKFFVKVLGCNGPSGAARSCVSCGGSLIKDKTVLTAAHCIESEFPYRSVETRDFTDKYSRKENINVRKTKVHSNWNPNKIQNGYDIAILKLSKRSRNRSPIRLCTSFDYSKYRINVIGMGRLNGGSLRYPKVLQQVRLQESGLQKCGGTDKNKQICLTGNGKDSCQGDSGGPAFPEKSNICLYGIVSYGSKGCDGSGVYTKVPAFAKWIKKYD